MWAPRAVERSAKASGDGWVRCKASPDGQQPWRCSLPGQSPSDVVAQVVGGQQPKQQCRVDSPPCTRAAPVSGRTTKMHRFSNRLLGGLDACWLLDQLPLSINIQTVGPIATLVKVSRIARKSAKSRSLPAQRQARLFQVGMSSSFAFNLSHS